MNALTKHGDYIARYGLTRWVLRECVRANPFYAASAALLAYGVSLLSGDMNPKMAVILALLLHGYEIAVLFVATVVMKLRNGAGGPDLHGLTMVAAIFMGGSFMAMDELLAQKPSLGIVLIPASLLLAAAKLAWYARLPGIFLPLRYRMAVLAVLAGHCVSPALGHPDILAAIGKPASQSLAWLAGWMSVLSVILLVWMERSIIMFREKVPGNDEVDVLQTRWCGGWAIFLVVATGTARLVGSDWVFNRPITPWYGVPVLTVALGALMLRAWYAGTRPRGFALILFALPAVTAHVMCWKALMEISAEHAALLLGPVPQALAAGLLFYLLLEWTTGHRGFYAGAVAVLTAPSITAAWLARGAIPHFRALFSALLGFILLGGGMVISIYRDRLLKWLDPHVPKREDDATAGPALLPES